jgi:hypothetical protein
MSTRGLAIRWPSARGRVSRREYQLADGAPAAGWESAAHWRRVSARLLDIGLFGVTLGIGWIVWTWRSWAHGTTPGKSLLGLTVFGTDTRRPVGRDRMALRALVYQSVVILIGVATLGLGWLYCVAATLGTSRRTVYDEWSHTVLLQRPR